MKLMAVLALTLISSSAFAGWGWGWRKEARATLREYQNECRATEVTVDEIVKNDHIKGHIKGLPTDAFEKFKVVFYVKTNRWYVHPYTYFEGQASGYSYSNLTATGEFKVKTVSRDIPSQKLAVVLVPKSYRIDSMKWWLNPLLGIFGGVLKYECNHTIVKGNGDFYM